MNSWHLKLGLWGVRGSFPTPAAKNLGFGGNTPCVEVRLPDGEILILDAGTGIRQLGLQLAQESPRPRHIHIFLSHFHWDHIHGLPFFGPLFDETRISFYSGGSRAALEQAIAGQMRYPYFPLDFRTDIPNYSFHDLARDGFIAGRATVRAFPVHHPQGASGFRVEAGGKSLVYVPDRESGNARLDALILDQVAGADILIHDAQYTPEEYGMHKGWGHSTWTEAVEVARRAAVKQLILFHHDPEHDDARLLQIEKEAGESLQGTCMAREGWIAHL
jgi:phosphoribosyl 1,2-cyclic phosphodiesterase